MCRPARMIFGQIVALVHPPGVGRAAGVAQQQRPGGPLGQRMLLGPVVGHRPVPLQPDVAVRIDQAGHQPDAGGDGLGVGDRLGADHTVDHPEVAVLAVGQHHAAEVQRVGATARRLLAEATAQLRRQLEVGHRLLQAAWSILAAAERGGRVDGGAGCWAALRLAGLPETPRPPFFFCGAPVAGGDPAGRGVPGIPGILPVASELIILRASKNR